MDQATIVGSLRAGDSFGRRAVSATVVTGTPCELFSLCCICTMSRELVLSCVKQLSVRSHFSSSQQLEIVRVTETSSGVAGESASQDLRFCVGAESRQCGAGGSSSDSASCQLIDVPEVVLDRCMYSHRSSSLQDLSLVPIVMQRQVWHYGWCGDGVDNCGGSKEKLQGCVQVLQKLSPISEKFTIAASFSNVHGVYTILG